MGLSSKKQKTASNTTSNTAQNTASTATTTTSVPDWIKNPTMANASNINAIIGAGAGAYTPQLSDLQKQAFDAAGNLTTSGYLGQAGGVLNNIGDAVYNPYTSQGYTGQGYDASGYDASGYTAKDYEASSLLDGGLDKYFNPYKDQVLNPVLADYDTQAGQTRAAQAASAAKNRAFQGSRYGVQEAQTEGQLARGRAATEGGLLSDMYGQATGLAATDAAARNQAAAANAAAQNQAAYASAGWQNQAAAANAAARDQAAAFGANASNAANAANAGWANQAAGQNAQGSYNASVANQQAALQRAQQLAALGLSEGSEARANLGVQAGLGGILTDFQNAQSQYPIQFAGQMNSLLQGLNPELYSGRTVGQTGTSTGTATGQEQSSSSSNNGLLSSLGQAAQIAALFPFPSDRRLKTKIRTLFRDWKGRRWVEYAYRWAPNVRWIGVIAQEVRKTDPDAVRVMPGGWLAVDYGRL